MFISRFCPPCAILLYTVLSCSLLMGRPGETLSELESRLLTDRQALKISSREVNKFINHKSVPYRNLYALFPEGLQHELYYKPATDEKASQTDFEDEEFPDGWFLHVIFYKGRSVFEAYRRNGANISNYEQDGLLSLNKGASFWKRASPNEENPSVIGYSFERDDGELRVLVRGNYFIIYMPEIDEKLVEVQSIREKQAAAEAKMKAPTSLEGF